MRFDLNHVEIINDGCRTFNLPPIRQVIPLDRLLSYSEYMSLAIMRFKSNKRTDQHQESSALFLAARFYLGSSVTEIHSQ
jgi:hypothetical protein